MNAIAVFEPSHRCKICVMIAQDPDIRYLVESTRAFNPKGRSGNSVIRELKVTPTTWTNHLKKHHYPMHKRDFQKGAELVTKVQGELIDRTTATRDNYEHTWDAVIDEGNRLIDSGQMRVTSLMLLKAAKDKADYMAKKQDHKLDAAKMLYAFAREGAGAPGITPQA